MNFPQRLPEKDIKLFMLKKHDHKRGVLEKFEVGIQRNA